VQLERSRAVLRTRKPYEAADLGLLLLRRLYRPTLWATLCFVLPVQIAVLWACSPFDLFYSYLALWWLKPLYDRPLGLVLGRGLFGEVPRGRVFMRALWTQGRRKLLADLTYRRFDPARSLVAPVALLEGVSGAVAGRRRHALVMANSTSVATLLLSCIAIETGCIAGISLGAMMLMPDELQFILTDLFSTDWDELLGQMVLGAYALAIALCEPLYVASGFGLYIDRRTTLEGWDIELAFRTMTRRLATNAAVALLIGSALCGAAAQAQPQDAGSDASVADAEAAAAQTDSPYSQGAASAERRLPLPEVEEDGQAEAAMTRVLARPELQREHVEEHWELRKRGDSDAPTEMPAWLAAFAKYLANSTAVLIWVLAAVALAILLYMFVEHVRHAAQATVAVPVPVGEPELRIRFDKLPGRPLAPSQVVPRARELLAAGDTTAALSVLYVGTLAALVLLDALEVPAQATEGECLRRVGAAPIAPSRRDLFRELTTRWQLSAYAHVVPEPDQVHGLCERFAACFGGPA
jgi:hypothetical protein